MVIVYVLASLGMGGAEKQVIALAERMAERGHGVKLLVLRPQVKEQWPSKLPVIHLDMSWNPLSVLRGLDRAKRFLRGYRPDIVHGHCFHANMLARLLKAFGNARIVVSTIHNVYEGGLHRMMLYRLTDFLCVQTTAVSAVARERFVRLKAVPASKCVVLTNGIDTAEFAPDATRRAVMRKAMGVGDEFVWLTAGRIAPAKDIPNLLRAFARVCEVYPDAQLWVAGEGDAAQVKRVSGVAVDSGVWGRVRWLGLRRDVAALMDAADGFVLASAWEGMPLVVGEAMAMEKPVVATDVGGVGELVGEAGSLVASKDSEALAAGMLGMMRRSGKERAEVGRGARERVVRAFDIEVRAEEWEGTYKSLLRG